MADECDSKAECVCMWGCDEVFTVLAVSFISSYEASQVNFLWSKAQTWTFCSSVCRWDSRPQHLHLGASELHVCICTVSDLSQSQRRSSWYHQWSSESSWPAQTQVGISSGSWTAFQSPLTCLDRISINYNDDQSRWTDLNFRFLTTDLHNSRHLPSGVLNCSLDSHWQHWRRAWFSHPHAGIQCYLRCL